MRALARSRPLNASPSPLAPDTHPPTSLASPHSARSQRTSSSLSSPPPHPSLTFHFRRSPPLLPGLHAAPPKASLPLWSLSDDSAWSRLISSLPAATKGRSGGDLGGGGMARGDGELELTVGVRGAGGGGGGAAADAPEPISLGRLILAGMVAGGVQYGWALQLSLLTPYVQTLGLSHALTSFMWLCGPIAGLVVQPLVGLYSDKCTARWGRRRPFILTGCLLICIAVVIVGFSSDIGAALGDTKEECSLYHGPRWHAAIVYVLGFWLLDFSNNTVQGPARALMADLSGHHGPSAANSIFCSWMALGNILGYSSGSTNNWHKWFPFLKTKACCEACANLKGAFLVAVVFLIFCLTITLIFAREVPFKGNQNLPTKANGEVEAEPTGPLAVFQGFKNLPTGMPSVLLVTGLTWLSWFPFILYDTDWMGREIYHGDPKGTNAQVAAFDEGVRVGSFGLLLNSIVLGFSSFLIEPMCRKVGPRLVWVTSNFMVCVAMAATALISYWSLKDYHGYVQDAITASTSIKAVCLILFAFLGVPLAILYSVPFAVTAQLAASKGGGQGLCTGVLNISIVIPQVIIALGAGPWDALFGKGNIPAFGIASGFALVGGIVGLFLLPKISKRQFRAVSGGGH